MNKTLVGSIASLVIIVGTGYLYTSMPKASEVSATNQRLAGKLAAGQTDIGTYPYECDEHVTFTLTIADEVASVMMKPKDNPALPPLTVLKLIPTPAGKKGHWFTDNNKYVLIGKGESVTLESKGSAPLNCSPVKDPNNAPWNWGD